MDCKLSKTIRSIFHIAVGASAILLLAWRFVMQGINVEQHYSTQGSAYLLGILGIVMVAVTCCMKILCHTDNGLHHLIVMDFMLATWIYLRSDAVMSRFSSGLMIEFIKVTMLTLLAVPVVMFFDEFQKYKYHRLYLTFMVLPVIDWACCVGALFIFGITGNSLYMASQIIIMMILMTCLYHSFVDYKKTHLPVHRQILIAMSFIFFGTLGEIFYVYYPMYYGMDILFGFLVFLSVIGVFQSITVMTVKTYLYESRKYHQMEANAIVVKLRGDVKTSLQQIKETNQYILEHCMNDEMFAKASILEREQFKLDSLLHNMEDCIGTIAGIEPFDLEKVDMKGVFNSIIDDMKEEIERKNVELDIRVEEKFPSAIWGVRYGAERMLFNMLLNAVYMTENNGRVIFQTGYLSGTDGNIKIITTVESDGFGLDNEQYKKIQHVFNNLQEVDVAELDGIGFGLQTAATFAKFSGSTMAIENETGKGVRIQAASICKVADDTPIGEFKDWYQIKETHYQKYRKRVIEAQKETEKIQVEKQVQEEEKLPVENTVDNKSILHAGNIHVEGALKYVGNDYEQYVQIMKLFPEKKMEKQKMLQQYYEERDYLNYTIQVHALKNNARMLGADSLADMAFEHEKAGTQKNEQFMIENYESLIAEWNRVESVFRTYLKAELGDSSEQGEEEAQGELTDDDFKTIVREMIDCLEMFQKKETLELIEKAKSYQLHEEQRQMITAAEDAVKRYDYDGALEVLKQE